MNINFGGARMLGAPRQVHQVTKLTVKLDGADLDTYKKLYPGEDAIREDVVTLEAVPNARLLALIHGQHENFARNDAEKKFVRHVLGQLTLDEETRAKFAQALRG